MLRTLFFIFPICFSGHILYVAEFIGKKKKIKGQTNDRAPIPCTVESCFRLLSNLWCFRPGTFRKSRNKVQWRALTTGLLWHFCADRWTLSSSHHRVNSRLLSSKPWFRNMWSLRTYANKFFLALLEFRIMHFFLLGMFRARVSRAVLASAMFMQNMEVRNYVSYAKVMAKPA